MDKQDQGIRVEFYGIPRQRSGAEATLIPVGSAGMKLAELVRELTVRYPQMAQECFDGDQLRAGYIANIDGKQFISDPRSQLYAGQTVLILASDAGG